MSIRELREAPLKPVARVCFGLWFMIQGAAGYERYMMTGDTGGAMFDATLQFVGFLMFWTGVARWHAAILRALEREARDD